MADTASSSIKHVVSETNQLISIDKLKQLAGEKFTLIFAHNSGDKSTAEFFDKCNEYLKGKSYTELEVVWCDYTASLASVFEKEPADDELRFCMVGLYMDDKYVGVKSAKDFVTEVEKAIKDDRAAAPKHVLYGGDGYSWPRCMCCCGLHDKVMRARTERIKKVAKLLNLKSLANSKQAKASNSSS